MKAALIICPKNVFYLTGYSGFLTEEKDAKILITKNTKYLFTDKRYLGELKKLKGFEIHDNLDFKEFAKKIDELEIEESCTTVTEYKALKKLFKKITNLSSPIEDLREIKNNDEIKNIEEAADIGDDTLRYIKTKIKTGVTEEEIALKIEMYIREQKADISFKPIVAFGKNSAIPHHQNSKMKLKKGMIVLLDFGVLYKNYCSDMTRTFFFGERNEKFEKIYETVHKAQKLAESSVGKNTKAFEIDKIARDYIESERFESIPHSLGHGIGLDVHEKPSLSPKSKDVLKPGMIFSIEPGVYLGNFGGVRIEDLYALTDKGLKKLTHSPSSIFYL